MVHRYMRISALTAFALAIGIPAQAWGPDAQRAVTAAAIMVVGHAFVDPFATVDTNYDKDVLAGAAAGRAILDTDGHLASAADAVNAVGTETQLLREVRKRGSGGRYFAYRMGVLAALASDVMFPLTFDKDAAGGKLCKQVESDIEKHLKSYQVQTQRQRLEYVRNPLQYFDQHLQPFAEASTLIKYDYGRGVGYNGYVSSSTPKLLQSTVEAIADVWFTVVRPQGDPSDVKPSEKSLTAYFADQVVYQLVEKKNMKEAERAYQQFAGLKTTSLAFYEKIGDAFYKFGGEGHDRGVQEWTNALAFDGPERAQIMGKLAKHYLDQGKLLLDMASKPNAPKDALPNALADFSKALEYDQGNEDAAKLINETQIKIAERDQRLELAIRTLSAAESVVKQAEQCKVDQQFPEAIAQYKKAITVFDQVGDEFAEQFEAADTGKEDAKLRISQIIKTVLDLASDRIEDGDRLVDQKKFDEAVNQYSSVETLLKVVPDDTQSSQLQEKKTLVDQAAQKVQDAEKARKTEEELQQKQNAVGGAPKR